MKTATIACATAISLLIGGCDTPPTASTQALRPSTSLQDYLQQASKAVADGSRDRARESYRAAAKAFPTSKEPWVKLAEDYFEASDYGNAVLAAQEVLQRDSADNVAASILAVSGLRISVSALQTLRNQNRVSAGTRTEAETMARTMREVLGESVLVPPPTGTPANNDAAARAKRTRVQIPPPPAKAGSPTVPAATGAPPAPPVATNPPSAAGGSPFDRLK